MSSFCARPFNVERQDDHLHAAQMQATLHGQCGLVVQQALEPVLVFEDLLAGEDNRVGMFAHDLLGEFG